jgi:2-polyprenyl-3-methyl-5-hydroxy-6-metoxy-1,4-benzoquinol methylase
VTCNICGSNDHEVITKRDREGYRTFKVLCRECGLIYTNPLPTSEELKHFYEQKSVVKKENEFIPKNKRIFRAAMRALPRYNRIKQFLKKGAQVLDTSACMGEFVYLLRKKGYDATGVELNRHFINYAEKEFGLTLNYHFLDQIHYETNSFDIISANHIINHYLNPLEVLKKYHNFLKPNGILNIEVSNIEAKNTSPFHRYRFKQFYNYNLYTLQVLARKAGFEVLNTILIPGSLHINVLLRKSEQKEIKIKSTQNYLKVRTSIKGYNTLNYLFSLAPYIKIWDNIRKHFKFTKRSRPYSSGKALLDDFFSKA